MNEESSKVRYYFRLRTLTDPAESATVEAGPFTPKEAEIFGHTEVLRRTMQTGKTWVVDYVPITDADSDDDDEPDRFYVIVLGFVAIVLVAIALALFR